MPGFSSFSVCNSKQTSMGMFPIMMLFGYKPTMPFQMVDMGEVPIDVSTVEN